MSTDRWFVWGVLSSFVAYVEQFGGDVGCEGSAVRLRDGRFAFAEHEDSGDASQRRFGGRVTFSAHGGLMFVSLAEPVLRPLPDADRAGWSLSFIAARGPRDRGERIHVAELTGDSGAVLHADGRALFDGRYAEGHALDDWKLVENGALGVT